MCVLQYVRTKMIMQEMELTFLIKKVCTIDIDKVQLLLQHSLKRNFIIMSCAIYYIIFFSRRQTMHAIKEVSNAETNIVEYLD